MRAALRILLGLSGLIAPLSANAQELMRVRVAEIVDTNGFGAPMVAARSLLPADWQTFGGITWNFAREGCRIGPLAEWNAVSPSGTATIAIVPTIGWRFNTLGAPVPADCINGSFNSAEDLVAAVVGQLGGRVVEFVPDPRVERLLAGTRQQLGNELSYFDTANARIVFTQAGQQMQGLVLATTVHVFMDMPSFSGTERAGYGQTWLFKMFAATADEFEDWLPVFRMFATNYRSDPHWDAAIEQRNRQMMEGARRASAAATQIMTSTYSEISSLSMEGWRSRNALQDSGQAQGVEAIRGVETYNADTPSGRIELPFGYDSAWQLDDGTFVVTEDRFFDPQRTLGLGGRQLSPAPN